MALQFQCFTKLLKYVTAKPKNQALSRARWWYQWGKYHCAIDLLFDWFGISCMTSDIFCFYLQNRLIKTSQTGGQLYSDTFPHLVFPVPVIHKSCCIFNNHNFFYQEANALAFNWDTCCHLVLSLQLIIFNYVSSYFVEPWKCQIVLVKSSWVHFSIEVYLPDDILPNILAGFAGQWFSKRILLFSYMGLDLPTLVSYPSSWEHACLNTWHTYPQKWVCK